ncbi:hypothetical protein C0991_005503 [Blastosporella zonata]|nr:hypothetical protein C0991_005503 [Blastosporella zonata]
MAMIPLGPDWTYGGLTSPASVPSTLPVTTTATAILTTTTNIPITTTTATPTSLPTTTSLPTIISITPTATPTSTTTASSSISLSNSFTATLASPSSTSSSTGAISHHFTRRELIGIIAGSIAGFIFLFIAAILVYLCLKGRKQREPAFEALSTGPQNETLWIQPGPPGSDRSYQFVQHAPKDEAWKERSPRMSGGEADPFLAQTTPDSPTQSVDQGMTQHANAPPPAGIARVPVPTTGTQSSKGSSGQSSATNHSGYGVVMEHPTLNLLPSTTEELGLQRRGHILTPHELARMNEEAVIPVEGEYPGPPPRLLDYLHPDEGWGPPNRDSGEQRPMTNKSSQNSLSAYPDANEAVTLLTARRVRVEELASRSPPRLTDSLGEGSSTTGGRGFLSSLGLDRLSWFKNSDFGSRRNSHNSYIPSPLNNEDVEMGKALLGPEMSELQPPPRGLGLFEGERPLSTASGRSAGTLYHDAHSSPGTPVSARMPIAPLPRALTPSGSGQQQSTWASSSTVPPVPDLPTTSHSYSTSVTEVKSSTSYSTSITNVNHGLPVGYDILDTPAPTAISPFASSTVTSFSSLRDTATEITQELEVHPFPPGLAAVPQKPWIDEGSSTIVTPPFDAPMNTNPFLSPQDSAAGISIDILEEAPPSAREGWRSLAAEQGFLGPTRRTTFGIPIPPNSDSGSLYSTHSPRSTGSDPASGRRGLSGSVSSASSRPSAFSAAHTHSSGGHSLAHSGSVSSDARISPAMSVFGPRSRPRSPQPPLPNAPPTAHYPPERAGTHRITGSQDMDGERRGMSSPEPMSPISHLSSAPWAGGLGDNWIPTP